MEQTTDQLFADVRAKLQSHDGQGAINLLWPYLSENHDDATARSLYGMALFTAGHTDTGISELRQATLIQPDGAPLHFNLAVALYQSGDKLDAQSECEEALRLDPSHAGARAMLDRLQIAPKAEESPAVPAPIPPSQVGRLAQGSNAYVPSPAVAVANGSVSGGMAFTPSSVTASSSMARAMKGLAWGAGYGQYWTLWSLVWMGVYNGSHIKVIDYIAIGIIYGVACGVVGSLVGLVVFLKRLRYSASVMAGLLGGLVLMAFEFALNKDDPKMLINVIFWAFTGRFIGGLIGRKSLRTA